MNTNYYKLNDFRMEDICGIDISDKSNSKYLQDNNPDSNAKEPNLSKVLINGEYHIKINKLYYDQNKEEITLLIENILRNTKKII